MSVNGVGSNTQQLAPTKPLAPVAENKELAPKSKTKPTNPPTAKSSVDVKV